ALSLAATGRRFSGYPEFLGFGSKGGSLEAFRGEAALEQLTDCRRAAGHALSEAEIVQYRQFSTGQHDLEPFAPVIAVRHRFPHYLTNLILLHMSNLLKATWFRKYGPISRCG